MRDDLDSPAPGPGDVLRSLKRALAIAQRRRRLRLWLVFAGGALLGVLTVLVVLVVAGA